MKVAASPQIYGAMPESSIQVTSHKSQVTRGFSSLLSNFRVVVAASPRSMAQVATVLAFVISHTTFLAAQDDETGRCLKVVFKSPVTSH